MKNKRRPFIIIILTVSVFTAPSLFALSGLSVQFGAGYNNDGMNMGRLIENGGLPFSPASIPTGQIIMSEKNLKKTGIINNLEAEGPMKGINNVLGFRMDFLNRFFIRIDGEIEKKVYGGNMTWDWNNSGFPSGHAYQTFDYNLWSVPVMIGINVPIKTKGKGNYNAYIGGGAVWAYGNCDIEIENPSFTVMGQPGYHEDINLSSMQIGLAWVVGLNAELVKNLYLFFEYREMNFNMEMKGVSFKAPFLNSMAAGQTLPVDISSKIVRVGLLYNLVSF